MNNNSRIEVVSPGQEGYETLQAVAEQAKAHVRVNYKALAMAYNEAQVGAIVLVDVGKGYKTGNLILMLKNRGLEYKKDFMAVKMRKDASGKTLPPGMRHVAVTKLSERRARE